MISKVQQQALQLLKNRYSHRNFIQKPIEEEVLNHILEVGLNAASGGNLQPVSVIMIRDSASKSYLAKLCKQGFIEKADTLLLYLVDYYRLQRWAEVQNAPFGREHALRDYIISIEDVMCMAQSMECAANILGVGSVYIGTVNAYYQELKEHFDLPKLTVPILMTCLGYSDDKGLGRKKLAQDIVVHQESYKMLSDDEIVEKIVNDKYDNWIQNLSGDVLDKYLAHFQEVATEVNGSEWSEEVTERIKQQQGINRAQYRFGWHYNPLRLRSYNKQIIDFLKDQGFKFLGEDK